MSWNVIESYSNDSHEAAGILLPTIGLVEDQDAVRLLVTDTPTVLTGIIERAADGGAQGVIIFGEVWRWASFSHRGDWSTSNDGTVTITDQTLNEMKPEPLPYLALLAGEGSTRVRQEPFVHLHAHSEFSALDGLSTVDEMVKIATDNDQPALAVTDHGVCAGHPALQAGALKAGIKPVFGIEAYFVPDRFARGVEKPKLPPEPKLKDFAHITEHKERSAALTEARVRWEALKQEINETHDAAMKVARDYQHIILWAMDDAGLRNLWAMSTAAYLEGTYYKPRLDWEILERYNEGVMASTACLRGPLAVPILRDDEEGARVNVGKLLNIFGDRLYAEIHTNSLEDQRKANEHILRLADEYGIPTIAAVDSHYPCSDDQHAHQVWLSAQTNKEIADDTDLFSGDEHYHLMGTPEVRQSLAYLPENRVDEMIANTLVVADRCEAAIKPRIVMPLWSKPSVGDYEARAEADYQRLVKLALGAPEDGWPNFMRYCTGRSKAPEVYMERFEMEMDLIRRKKFCGYFLMEARQVRHAKDSGILVGPGRGSGAGCLVAYLTGITGIDPVEADLLFERFLTEDRNEPPDFDVDYPSSHRDFMQDFCTEEWGADHTMRVGSVIRLKNRGVFSSLASVFKSTVDFKDFADISKIIVAAEESTSGAGLKWDELWAQHGDELEPYKLKYPEIFELADRFRGRLKSYGKHAAGMVIAPDEILTDNLPMRTSENSNQPISQFDMDALTLLGYIKFDLLTLRTLDTLQICIDLIKEHRGRSINPDDWHLEYQDAQVWDEICEGNTLGIFQIETSSGTRLVRRFQPRSIRDLSDVITLVRPGPVKSGLTESYFRRREGIEEVVLPDPRLAESLAPSQGCIIYQEQVMKACQVLGNYTLSEADTVRSILGKKKIEKVAAAGEEFIRRCSANGMTHEDAVALWDQLGEFAKYSFNKSHAWSYAVIGYWTAWFKFHYPTEFLTAALSTVKPERIPEFVNEARRMGRSVKAPDINDSGIGFGVTAQGCRYGFDGIDGIGKPSAQAIIDTQPYTSFEDFMERRDAQTVNRGIVKKLVRSGAFDSLGLNRRSIIERLDWEDSPEGTMCLHKNPETLNEHGLPCTFDWSSEPVLLGKTNRPLKNQPKPPKNCTKGCRNYTPPAIPDFAAMPDFKASEVRAIEKELLGIYVSSTPFDFLSVPTEEHPETLAVKLAKAADINNGPPGVYTTCILVAGLRPYQSPRSGKMGFANFATVDGNLDVTLFKDTWAKHHAVVIPGTMAFVKISKNDRGLQLLEFVSFPAPD